MIIKTLLAVLVSLTLIGCGGDDDSTDESSPGNEPQTLEAQIERGSMQYAARCSECHGANGQGSARVPPLIGSDALPLEPRDGQNRDVEFHTAKDVFQWADANMPPGAPGSVPDADMLAILAFALDAKGVTQEAVLTTDNAASIALH